MITEYTTAVVDDVPAPSELEPDVLYSFLRGGRAYVAFACPCGCVDPFVLPVREMEAPSSGPWWRFDGAANPTLSPSIARRGRCGAHFFIRGGRVQWCGRPPTT